MSTEDNFIKVPKNRYVEELEEKVRSYMRNSPVLEKNNIKHRRVTIPSFSDEKEKKAWEWEQIRRCVEGHDGMTGKMYFFFHFCWIKNLKKGKIRPNFQVCQNEWYNAISEAQASHGEGLVCVKRRRIGASWMEAADILHDMAFNRHLTVGMNSKTARDTSGLFKKILFIYEGLPEFLKPKLGQKLQSENSMLLRFFDKKNPKKGNHTELIAVAPTDTAFESQQLAKWVCDEAGKLGNLPTLYAMTEPCLMEGFIRRGCPVIFGTSGDIGKTGAGLMHIWDHYKAYNMRRFFFAGWMGIDTDEFGNDNKEEVVRWIYYKRKELESVGGKRYNDFVQQYPLTPEEAFSQAGAGIADAVKVNAQKARLRGNPPVIFSGYMREPLEEDQTPIFTNKVFGELKIYEHPNPKKRYVIGCDPADHDDAASSDVSDLSLHVLALPHGTEPPKIVAEMCYRPQKLTEYYEQACLVARYYNESKILVENNRYRMISYFTENSLHRYLERTPANINQILTKAKNSWGIKMTEDVRIYLEEVIYDYVEDYSETIPSVDLLSEMLEYGSRNTDRIISFGLALIMLKNNINKVKQRRAEKKYDPRLPDIKYRTVNGKIQRYSPTRTR